jgi:hypothetical protein
LNKIKIILLLITLLNILSSCGKYEDGPAFSFLTKKNRLVGHWEINEISGPAKGVRSINPVFAMEFGKDGNGYLIKIDQSGLEEKINYKWMFWNMDEKIKLEYDTYTSEHYIVEDSVNLTIDSLTFQAFEIMRLKKTELWIKGYYDMIFKFEKK